MGEKIVNGCQKLPSAFLGKNLEIIGMIRIGNDKDLPKVTIGSKDFLKLSLKLGLNSEIFTA